MTGARAGMWTAAAAAAAVAGLAWWLSGPSPDVVPAVRSELAPETSRPASAPGSTSPPGGGATASLLAEPLDTADLDALVFDGAQSLSRRLRRLTAAPLAIPPDERRQEVDTLEQEVHRLEDDGRIAAVQAVWLRIALLRARHAEDEARFESEARRLLAEYRERAAAHEAKAREALRQESLPYRRAQLEVLREIDARRFPDEATRQRVLRERLQSLRSQLHEQTGDGEPSR